MPEVILSANGSYKKPASSQRLDNAGFLPVLQLTCFTASSRTAGAPSSRTTGRTAGTARPDEGREHGHVGQVGGVACLLGLGQRHGQEG